MEIIESIVWVGLGFFPTLAILEIVSKRHGVLGVHTVRTAARLRQEVEA